MTVEQEIARLEGMSSAELRTRWRALVGTPAPRVSPAMLRLALAWEIQARAYGGLSRETSRTLDQLARGLTRTSQARPGMRLVREWQGKAHVVTVEEANDGDTGVIHWDGRE